MNQLPKVSVHITMLVVAATSAACGDRDVGEDASRAESSGPQSEIATTDYKGPMGFQAGIEGTLELQDGCFYLISNTSGTEVDRLIPVFPEDRVAGSEPGLLVLDGTKYDAGESVSLTGGRVRYLIEEGMAVPETCDEDSYMWMVSPN